MAKASIGLYITWLVPSVVKVEPSGRAIISSHTRYAFDAFKTMAPMNADR